MTAHTTMRGGEAQPTADRGAGNSSAVQPDEQAARPAPIGNGRAAQFDGLLTSREVCTATGVTYRQLSHWAACGIVRPVGSTGRHGELTHRGGTGHAYRWHPDQLPKIRALAALSRIVFASQGGSSAIMRAVAASHSRTGPWIFHFDGLAVTIELEGCT